MGASTVDLQSVGLSSADARRLREVHGPNALPEVEPPGILLRFLRQFQSPLIYVLLFALALDGGLWLWQGTQATPFELIAIGVVLIVNACLGVYQEAKAEKALQKLNTLAAPAVWAVRDHQIRQIPSRDVVPGDVLRIEAGDRVPADGPLLTGEGILADEAILTGESLPVEKSEGAALSSGTLIVRGKGYLKAARTGAHSAMGRLATMITGIETGKTPLEKRLDVFANNVAIAIIGLAIALTLGGIAAEGWGRIGHTVLFAVALAVAAIPEGLPAVLTLTLALGVERLSRRKAIVRRLSAVEALGSVTVIATDKTGTLTENRMQVRSVATHDLPRALKAMTFANDAEIASEAGDPLEVALHEHVVKEGLDAAGLLEKTRRISSRPFDSATKFMRVTVDEDGHHISYLKGAPETLLARSRCEESERVQWEQKSLAMAREGFRVIGLAWGAGERENDLDFLGLVMLWDPPRPEARAAVDTARSAGLRIIMITGDHPETAAAMARVIGVPGSGVITGSEFASLPANVQSQVLATTNVFARVSPADKLAIVRSLKESGEVVAVTGDGINDAPALRISDVGVAMGRGSDVAREVADVVLIDDNLATVVAAIEEGRSIYENIQKIVRLMFSTNLALVLLILAGLLWSFVSSAYDPQGGGLFLPLTAAQLLWINVVTDGPAALALTLDRNPNVMLRPPRPVAAKLLDPASLRFIWFSGLAKAAIGVALLVIMPWAGYTLEETRTSIFLYESLAQLVVAYPARALNNVPLSNPALHFAVAGGALIQIATVLVPELRAFLQLVPIDTNTACAIAAGVGLSYLFSVLAAGWATKSSFPFKQQG